MHFLANTQLSLCNYTATNSFMSRTMTGLLVMETINIMELCCFMFTNNPHSSQSLSFKKCNKSFCIIYTYLRRDYTLQIVFPQEKPSTPMLQKNPIYQYSNLIKSFSSSPQSKTEFSSSKTMCAFSPALSTGQRE